jgi:GTPase
MSFNQNNDDVAELDGIDMSEGEESSEGLTSSRVQRLSRVAIIGRPNVGKSTLFNYLTISRKAVVKDEPGVTRDILIEPGDIWGLPYEVIDTGGLTESTENFSQLIREQVIEFLTAVDLLIVVMDGRAGLCPEDRDVIRIAKETGRPFLVVVNKLDRVHEMELKKTEFYEFGMDVVACSFEHRLGVDQVLEWISENVKKAGLGVKDGMTIAMVGKPNVGKSSLVNRLLGEKRVLVSSVAGTTTDSVNTHLVFDDRRYTLIDTAGLRRSRSRSEDLEIISAFKSKESIRRADIVLLVVDGNEGPTEQDAKILQGILEIHRAVILVANKTDTAEKQHEQFKTWFKERVETQFHFFTDITMVFVSALTGKGIDDLLDTVLDTERKLQTKISTRDLNDFFMKAIRQAPAPVHNTKNVKFYYLTQTQQQPPAFIAFANFPDSVDKAYRRFLAKRIQEQWHLQGIPIRIFVMQSRRRPGDDR